MNVAVNAPNKPCIVAGVKADIRNLAVFFPLFAYLEQTTDEEHIIMALKNRNEGFPHVFSGLFSGLPGLPVVSLVVIMFAFVLVVPCKLWAADRNDLVYTVAKVKLDYRADNAVIAKQQALSEGPLLALRLMFKRLAPFRAYDRLKGLTLAEADEVIDGVAVRSEQNSSTRYLALLDYSFSRQKMRQLLIRKGVPYFDQRSRRQVLMPVSPPESENGEGGAGTGTGGGNDWWRAWRIVDMKHALTDTRLYRPKAVDRRDWEQIANGNRHKIALLYRRYATQNLVLAEAKADASGSKLVLRLFGKDQAGPIDYRQDIPVRGDMKKAYEKAAIIAFGIIEGRWREPRITGEVVALPEITGEEENGGAPSVDVVKRLIAENVFLRVVFRGLKDWQQIRKRLHRIPGVQKLQVNSLSPRGADIRMVFPGGARRLQRQLASHQFRIDKRGDELVLRSTLR